MSSLPAVSLTTTGSEVRPVPGLPRLSHPDQPPVLGVYHFCWTLPELSRAYTTRFPVTWLTITQGLP